LAVYGVFLLFPLGRSVWISLFTGRLTLATGPAPTTTSTSSGRRPAQRVRARARLIVFYSVLPVSLALLLTMALSRGARTRAYVLSHGVFLPGHRDGRGGHGWSAIYSPDGVLNNSSTRSAYTS